MHKDLFNKITELDHLFLAWDEFKGGKMSRKDVMNFEFELEKNIFQLHKDLRSMSYKHRPYEGFFISDPKRRHVHKATVRDRIVHHTVFSVLNPLFEKTFIDNSFSCRVGKGSHKGVGVIARILKKESRNNTMPCYVLKCDIQKFFDNIDHRLLLDFLYKRIGDQRVMWLLREIIGSYESGISREREREREKALRAPRGIPIGNLTSQLFANIYMNCFDQFMKHELRVKCYARYTDDFIIISHDHKYLADLLPRINNFLKTSLYLNLHPNKIEVRKYSQGIDFLGYIIFPYFRLIRKRTWGRILRKFKGKIKDFRLGKITEYELDQSLQSYLGVLSHADTKDLTEQLMNQKLFF